MVFVGIDLGTTYSVVSYINSNGEPEIIGHDFDGDIMNVMPSVVLFGQDRLVIGAEAKKYSKVDSPNYSAFVKRHMGEKTYRYVTKDGHSYRAEEISALILSKLKEKTENRLGKIDGAVVTVPAYFSDPQRKATKDACMLAGINLIEMINEPSAAAIAFGYSRDINKAERIMVYDFGGGTFDVSILEISGSEIKVIGTNGNHQLGGIDIDEQIVNYFLENCAYKGISENEEIMQALLLEAERVKESLSNKNVEEIKLHINDELCVVNIKREEFENIIYPLVGTTISVAQRALDEVGLKSSDINRIILVGGSSKIPLVREVIEEEFEIKPSFEINPDEAVAIGAAYRAYELGNKIKEVDLNCEKKQIEWEKKREQEDVKEQYVDARTAYEVKNYTFRDVVSHGIGVLVYNSQENKYENSVLMGKNTEIPAKVYKSGYAISPQQNEISVRITQGESENPEHVLIVGNARLFVEPKDDLRKIGFVVSCDDSGLIQVYIYDEEDGSNLGVVEVDRDEHNLTKKELYECTENVSRLIAKMVDDNKLDRGLCRNKLYIGK